jgi:hypothetical protein
MHGIEQIPDENQRANCINNEEKKWYCLKNFNSTNYSWKKSGSA